MAPFTNGKVIRCPFRDLPFDKATLGPPANLSGQLSRGATHPEKDLPSLAVPKGEEVNVEDYTARGLAEKVMKQSTNLRREENAVNVGDATTGTGGAPLIPG